MKRRSGRRRPFGVLIATDGSASAQAAVATAKVFPWPPASRVRGVVVASMDWGESRSRAVREAFAETFGRVAATARRALARQWLVADVVTVRGRPADAILRAARRFRADTIVVG